jgi:hypothetical protein
MISDDRWKVSSVDEGKNRAKTRPLWYTADKVNQTRTDTTTTDRWAATGNYVVCAALTHVLFQLR